MTLDSREAGEALALRTLTLPRLDAACHYPLPSIHMTQLSSPRAHMCCHMCHHHMCRPAREGLGLRG